MTERPHAGIRGFAHSLTIGRSTMSWDGEAFKIELDEVTAPFPSRIRGVVKVHPASLSNEKIALDRDGRHHWSPIAPSSHVEVDLRQPGLQWSGPGYLDSNIGAAPLEDAFEGWSWSRAKVNGETAVLYDVLPREGEGLSLAMRFDSKGRAEAFEPPPRRDLPATRWRIRRQTRADDGHTPQVRRTFEDAPFYARSLLSTRLLGAPAVAMHESLSLDRFKSNIVKAMLPFRMPRWPT
jgi:carotenoid 1,2-hydratase